MIKPITVKVDKKTYDSVVKIKQKTGITIKRFIEDAIKEYVKKYAKSI